MRQSIDPGKALADLWQSIGGAPEALDAIRLTGADPVLPSSFAIGTAAQVSIAAAALSAAELHHLRNGARPSIAVDMSDAALEFCAEHHMRIDGEPPPDPWDPIAGAYVCGDGGQVRIHTNFPHHRAGIVSLLGGADDRAAVAKALSRWSAAEFEDEASSRGLVAARMRSFAEWDEHPQGRAEHPTPLIAFGRLDDCRPEPLRLGRLALSGIRVLDLTRIIAGPVGTRLLAAHGADVLRVSGPHLPEIPALLMETGLGKRSAFLDFNRPADLAAMDQLVREADVIVGAYRPGSLEALGLAPERLARLRPGLVMVWLSAYGREGPWAQRRGFDSIVQTATGFNHAEAVAASGNNARPLPCQAIDHASGHLIACAAMTALHRRALTGGSWNVRLSLSRTGLWIRRLGRLGPSGFAAEMPPADWVAPRLAHVDSPFGRLSFVRHAAQFSHAPPRWNLPPPVAGSDPPGWLAG